MKLKGCSTAVRFVVWSILVASPLRVVGAEEPLSENTSVRFNQIAETILLYQRDSGGWPKNYDRQQRLSAEKRQTIVAAKSNTDSTIDNGATYREIRLLT